ncbi:sortase family protein [Anoxybacillus sp. B7M1]|jgi:sortase A|uniref:class D sortase n=1 Tax=Anoxybacillaceae TaxID=3120669 RepID=UPI0005CDC1AD|nr:MULTISPECIES: class D sortase [Anoxybacillus]ANB56559.1 sortase family protein [Anoxybacillus sp. B2M1]ANB62709.1 sortase family protein [Anoxybacillus sp. B7M1]MBB3907792.1 sortase A [Anoxybacillus rupiensis]
MRKRLAAIFIVIGLSIIFVSMQQILETKEATQQALQTAEQIVDEKKGEGGKDFRVSREQFSPKGHDVIGILYIPKIDGTLPIVEGTEEEMLRKGVGHHVSTAFPGDHEQILLSGHRDTVFRKFGDLEVGDRFVVKMPYGTFEYEMKKAEIVEAHDTSVIGPKGEEVLTLSTCYPFHYVGPAPERYVIYAYPVD